MIADFAPPESIAAVEWAGAYARAGMCVFPCNAEKKPLTPHGLKDATTDEATIRAWWTKWPHADPAWAVPEDVVVVDVDVGDRGDGYSDFKEHTGVSPDEIPTPQASTPRGGRHIVCAANGVKYRNGVGVNGTAIDIRTVGGYVVLPRPGNGRAWITATTGALAPVPDFVAKKRPSSSSPAAAAPFCGTTTPYARAALDDACDRIETAGNGEQEATLNRECFSIGGLIGTGMLDKETAIARLAASADLMPTYAEPWGDLAAKVRRSVDEGERQPRQRPNGGGHPETEDQASDDPYPLKWHGDPNDTPLKDWAVEGMLPKIGKALMVGQWGVYKTFLALDLSFSFMTMTPFAGRAVHLQGGVLFVAAEGQNEVRVRLAGIAQEKAAQLVEREGVVTVDPAHMPFVWIESCPLLTSETAAAELCRIIAGARAEMLKRFRLPLVAVFIDTLMVAAGFNDADDSSEAQRVMSVLTVAAVKSKLLIIPLDHLGKNASSGTRNSSVKEDAVEAVLAVIADKDLAGTVKNPRLAIRKQKASATGEQIPFEMKLVTLEDGATTLVVDWSASEQAGDVPRSSSDPKAKPWPASLIIFKRALDNTLGNVGRRMRPFVDGPEVFAAKRDAVRAEFVKTYPADTSKAKAVAFLRCEKLALAGGVMAMRTLGEEEEAATYFWKLGLP